MHVSKRARRTAKYDVVRAPLFECLPRRARCIHRDVVSCGEPARQLPRDDGHGAALRARCDHVVARLIDESDTHRTVLSETSRTDDCERRLAWKGRAQVGMVAPMSR